MTPLDITALVSGMAALWLWALAGYWWDQDRQAARCHGVTGAPPPQHGRPPAYTSFVETEVYATSAGYQALPKSTT